MGIAVREDRERPRASPDLTSHVEAARGRPRSRSLDFAPRPSARAHADRFGVMRLRRRVDPTGACAEVARSRAMDRATDPARAWSTSDTITAVLAVLACAAWMALRA